MNARQGAADIVSNAPLLLCEGDSDERLLGRIDELGEMHS